MSRLLFDVGNTAFAIESLSPALDEAFVRFYAARLGSGVLHPPAFDAAAMEFLSGTQDPGLHDLYFSNFTPLWNLHLRSGNLQGAAAVWPWALRPVEQLEAQGKPRMHKGSAYYFWGMTALLADDLDRGYVLMHRGLEEDVLTHGVFDPSTPGFALAILDNDKPDQAFRPWVEQQATAVSARIQRYESVYGRTFDLSGLRSRFLALPALRDAAFMFSYAMAQVGRLLALPAPLWTGPFPAQLAFDVVFDLCLVVDSAIHHKNPGQHPFIVDAAFLSQHAGFGIARNQLRDFNNLFRQDFQGSLTGALNQSLALPAQAAVTGLPAALLVTYGCRNRGAHSVTFFNLQPSTFDSIVDRLVATLCITVETLY